MPPLTPEQTMMLLQYLITQGGMNPAALGAAFGRTPIDVDKEGNPVPQGLDSQAQAQTFQRGSNSLLADPVTGIFAGPAGYSAQAFEPIVDYSNPIERPGEQQLNYYINRNEGTMGNLVAQHLRGGGDAASAYASIMQVLNDEQDTPAKQMLLASLPDMRDNQGQLVTDVDNLPVKDFGSIYKFAQDLEAKIASDPAQGAYVDPATNQSYNVSPSPAAKEFTDKGWALPTDRYSVEQLMGPEWAGQMGGITDPREARTAIRSELIDPASAARRMASQALLSGRKDVDLMDISPSLRSQPDRRDGTPGGIADFSNLTPEQITRLMESGDQGEQGRSSGIGQGGAMFRDVLGGKAIQDLVNQTGVPGLLGRNPIDFHGSGAPGGIGQMAPQPAGPNRGQQNRIRGLEQADRRAMAALAAAHTAASQRQNAQFGRDYYFNKGRSDRANELGRTPLLDQFMARRMATIAGGVPGGYLPNG